MKTINNRIITMKKRVTSLCVIALMCMAHCYAGVTLTVPDVSIAPGGTSYVVIDFDLGSQPYTAYQFDIAYPEGISSVNDNNGQPEFLTGNVYNGHSVSSGYAPGGLARFQCFSTNSAPLTAQSGTLLTLSIAAAKSMAEGTYQATISPIEFVQTDATPDRPDAVTFNIIVSRNVVLDESSTIPPTAALGINVRVLRTIQAGKWSTICLPFAITEEQMQTAFGSGVTVELADFNDYEYDETTDAINVKFIDASAIEANHPYLIRVSKAVNEITANNVDVNPQEAIVDFDTSRRKNQPRQMVGTYVADTELEWGTLFLSDNKFWYSTGLTKMKAFRAYFNFNDVLAQFEDAAVRIAMNLDGEVTAVRDVTTESQAGQTYDLQGRRIAKPSKGLYIRNGRKEVIK